MSSEILNPDDGVVDIIDWTDLSSKAARSFHAMYHLMDTACKEDGFTLSFGSGSKEGTQIIRVYSWRRLFEWEFLEYSALLERWSWILDRMGLPKRPLPWFGEVYGPFEGKEAGMMKELWVDVLTGQYYGWVRSVLPYHGSLEGLVLDWGSSFDHKDLSMGDVFVVIDKARSEQENVVSQIQFDSFPVIESLDDALCGELVSYLFEEEKEDEDVDLPLDRQYRRLYWLGDEAASMCSLLIFKYERRVRWASIVLFLADVRKVALQIARGEDGPGLRGFQTMKRKKEDEKVKAERREVLG